MNKETFIKAIEALEKQENYNFEFSEKLGKCFPNAHSANLLPDNHFLSNILIQILQEEMNDMDNWIEWFCYEKDFGKYEDIKAYDEDGKEIPMSTTEELYNFLITRPYYLDEF
jgi:hypothetical protein